MRRFLITSGILFAIFLVIVTLAWAATSASSKSAVSRRLSAIRAAGDPATLADLGERHYVSLPDEENGALLIEEAFALAKQIDAQSDLTNLPIVGTAKLPAHTEPEYPSPSPSHVKTTASSGQGRL